MSTPPPTPPYRELRRSNRNRMLAGVCGGLGEFFGIDPTVIRLLFIFGVIFGWGVMILVYFVLFLVVPEDTQSMPSVRPVAPAPPVPPEPMATPVPPAPQDGPAAE